MDETLEGVRELGDDDELKGGLPVVGTETTGGVLHIGSGRPLHNARARLLEELLDCAELGDIAHIAIPNDHIGFTGQDRGDESWDGR